MKLYRSEFMVAGATLGCMLALCATAPAATIEVDADGGDTLIVSNSTLSAQTLAVGTDNDNNSLVITNTGSVTVDSASVGSKDHGHNTVLVTGSNAYLQVQSKLNIGTASGSEGNQVTVADNAWVFVGDLNTNLPAGSGISVGTTSTNKSATLSIGSGSQVEADNLLVGTQSNAIGSVSLTGADATFALSNDLLLGTISSSNSLTVANGASLTIGNDLMIGSTNNTGNQLTIGNGGSVVVAGTTTISNPSNNVIKVNSGGNLGLSQGLDLDDDTDGIDIASGASLELGGSVLANTMDHNLDVTLTGVGTTWSTTTNHLIIGGNTDGNNLTLKDGASLTNATGGKLYVGQGSDSNELVISGTNSTLLVSQNKETFVGADGSDNTFTVESNAVAHLTGALKAGNTVDATGNTININSGASLTADSSITVGVKGGSNTFSMDSGQVSVGGNLILGSESIGNRYYQAGGTNTVFGDFIMGMKEGASGETEKDPEIAFKSDSTMTDGNLAFVSSNAYLDIKQDLNVGMEGAGSVLVVRDGASVNIDGDAIIGEGSGDNVIYLQRGSNTLFHVGGDLIIDKEGGINRFAAYGGTTTIDGDVLLGASTNQLGINNFIHLDTTDAVLNVANAIYIGASNSFNTFDIVNGATANTYDLNVGTYDGVSNNFVTVKSEDSQLQIANVLNIGSPNSTENAVIVIDGGILQVDQSKINISGSNNVLEIADGGTLKTGDWDFSLLTGSKTNVLLESGSTLHLLGELSGTNMVEGGLTFVLNGTNSSWNTSTNDMYVGYNTDNNSLIITNGAMALTSNSLLIGTASTDNAVIVSGTGSSLYVGSDLYVGSETNRPVFSFFAPPIYQRNTVMVMDGATLDVGGDAFLYNGAVLKIGSTSQVSVTGDYNQDRFSTLGIGVSSNQVQPNLVVGGTAAFAKSFDTTNTPMIRIYDEGITDSNTVTIVQAGDITVDGKKATASSIEANIATNLLLGFDVSLSNDLANTYIVLDNFISHTIGQAGNLSGQLLDVANEIESLSDTNSNLAAMKKIIADMSDANEVHKAMDNYYGERMSTSPAHNTINLGLQSVSEQLTKRADNTRARMAAVASAPNGAQGPHMADQELQGWITGFRTKTDRSADSGFDGYNGDIGGILIGGDLAVADGILFGVAGGSASSTMDKDNGASTDTHTKFGSLYASAGNMDWFMDASLIYAHSSVDSSLGSVFDTRAEYDAQNVAVYVGGGKEIIGNYLIFTPQASLLGNYYEQDAYTETGTTAVPRNVDRFNTFYMQSSVGCNVGFYSAIGDVVVKPEFRAFWLHEFNAKEEDVAYSLVGGTGSYSLQLQSPESDIFKLGGGVSAKLGEYLEVRTDLDARMASGYSDYTLLGSIRYQF